MPPLFIATFRCHRDARYDAEAAELCRRLRCDFMPCCCRELLLLDYAATQLTVGISRSFEGLPPDRLYVSLPPEAAAPPVGAAAEVFLHV